MKLTLLSNIIIIPHSPVAEVVSEEAIIKWYKEVHSPKGKMHFLEQMKKFIEWLQNAEEGKLMQNTRKLTHTNIFIFFTESDSEDEED